MVFKVTVIPTIDDTIAIRHHAITQLDEVALIERSGRRPEA